MCWELREAMRDRMKAAMINATISVAKPFRHLSQSYILRKKSAMTLTGYHSEQCQRQSVKKGAKAQQGIQQGYS